MRDLCRKLTGECLDTCSEISSDRYHQLSDATMDTMLESLEALLDEVSNPSYEVEYSVSIPGFLLCYTLLNCIEWRFNSQFGRKWYLCHQQAAPKQANMALVAN